MSNGAVDTRTVEMRFDNSNFESNVKQSMSTLEKLKRALKLDGASTGLKEVERASRKLDFRDFKGNIDGVGKRFSVLETIATGALLKIGSSAAEAGMRIAKSLTVDQVTAGWNKYEEKVTSVQTIMANIRDTQGQFVDDASKMNYVNTYLEKLMWFADETSYSFTEMTNNIGKFIANGQGLEESVTAMQGIATWAALSGQRSQAAARAMYNISQALGTGSMKIIDWRSIENANMATAEFKETAIDIAVAMGKLKEGQVTIENFRDSLSGPNTKDWFDKDVMMAVFEKYGEAADRIQQYAKAHGTTATEAIREIKKTDKEFADSLGFRAFAAAQEAKTFSEVVDATADAVSTKWTKIFENIFGNYLQAKELWTDLSEQMWEIFAQPLDTLNSIMTRWNRGFFSDGPQNIIQRWFEAGRMDDLNNGLEYVTENVAQMAVATDKAHYAIEELEDGTKQLVWLIETSPGEYQRFTKKIYQADETLLSGREMLLQGFQNIFDAVIHDVYDEDGKLESISFFGSLKRGLQEVIFGTSDMDKIIPMVSKKLWGMSKRFQEFTEKLKPSQETSEKLKNSFKGLLTLFKIGGKFVKAVVKPFKDLFGKLFKNAPKSVLNLADSIGTWIQKLDQFLDKNKIFDTVSTKVKAGLDKMQTGFDNLSKALTGMSIKDLGEKIRKAIFGFFENYDFKGTFNSVVDFFRNIFAQIRGVNTEELPEKLTPLQNFWVGIKRVFEGMKKFFSLVSPAFKWVGEFINKTFTSITSALSNKKAEKSVSRFKPLFEGIRKVFKGIGDFFAEVGPTLEKVGSWIGTFFSNLGKGIAEWAKDKTPEEVIQSLVKGGFIISLTNLINSIAGLGKGGGKIGKAIAGDLNAVKSVLKAYAREINASALVNIGLSMALLAGSMWVLAQIPEEDMDKAGEALMNIAVAVAFFMYALEKIRARRNATDALSGKAGILDGLKELMTATIGSSIFGNDGTAKFVKIALGILLAAAAAKRIVDAISKMGNVIVDLSKIPEGQLKQGGKIVANILGAFSIFALFAGFSRRASSALFAALGAIVFVKAIKNLANYMAELGSDDKKMDNIQKVVDRFKYVFVVIREMAEWAIKIAAALTLAEIVIAALSTGKLTDTIGMSKVMKEFGKNFLRVAASLVIIGIAMAIMASVAKNTDSKDFKSISGFLIAFYSIVGVIQTIAIGLSSYAKAGSDTANILKQFGKNYTRIAGSLLILAAAFWLMSKIQFKNATFNSIAATFGVFLAIVGVLSMFSVATASMKKSQYFVANMKAIANTFIAVAASLAIVAGAFAIMTALDFSGDVGFGDIVAVFGGFLLLVTAISAISLAIGKKADAVKGVKAVSGMALAIAASLVILSAAFLIMSKTDMKSDEMWNIAGVFGAFAGVVAALAGLGFLIGKFGKWDSIVGIGAVAVLMVSTAVSLGIVVSAFALLASVATVEQMQQAVRIIQWFGIVVGALAVVGVIAGAIPGAFLGLLGVAALILSIGAACLMAGVGIGVAVIAFGLFADALANLVTAIAENGPEFAENVDGVIKAVLLAIIDNAQLFVDAGAAMIAALMVGIGKGIQSAGSWIGEKVKELWSTVKQSFSYEIDEHGFRVDLEPNTESAEEAGRSDREAYEQGYSRGRRSQARGGSSESYSNSETASQAGADDADAYYEQYLSAIYEKINKTESTPKPSTKTDSSIGKDALGQSGLGDLISQYIGTDGSLPGLKNGTLDFGEMIGLENVDLSSFETVLGDSFGNIDMSSLWSGKADELITAMNDSSESFKDPADQIAANIEAPITSIDSNSWGAEIGSGLAAGLRSEIPTVDSAAYDLAAAVSKYIHFSEPDVGPLSDFHTYAPDMIRLWCKGVKDNLGMVENSSYGVADTVYDGFSTALDYVSDLIDNGMSDQLTIRPVMDLTEIQNGMNSMSSMLSSDSGYTITGTTNLAGTAAYGMRTVNATPTEAQTMQTDIGPTSNNFYITNSDPNAVAEKVSKILNNQTRRQKAVWAYK